MNKLYVFLLCVCASLFSLEMQAERIVGGDLSMVPAYEQAGDKWLNASDGVITNLLTYVKGQGWNAVRVRLFVDPSQDSDPATCQDLDYVLSLGKRVKAAGLKLVLDIQYSDTWADPSTQKIPASWTDHTDTGLASQVYSYSVEVVTKMIEGEATPDYVQLGNEITYGLLWNTTDGKYPSSSSQYATAGYCPTWSATYSTGAKQWKRTARLLNNAAHGVHQAFADKGLDSTQVKLIVHTELGGNDNNNDYFFKHLRTAGFTNYDVIGLSYYPFIHGKLSKLSSYLNTLASDFPSKEVQIVETGWYNNYYPYDTDGTNEYSIATLNSSWTANASGMVNYLTDLVAELKAHSNVTGLLYWQPEEVGNGYKKTVMNTWMNRGLWWCNYKQEKHWLVKTSTGANGVKVLGTYLKGETGVQDVKASTPSSSAGVYDLQGRLLPANAPSRGIVVKGGKKYLRK